jgi:hypothetical protein
MTGNMRWWFAAFVVAVFLAGTSVGVVVDRLWLMPRGGGPAGRLADGPPIRRPLPLSAEQRERLAAANLNRLQNRLRLTEAQRSQAQPIIEAWQTRVGDLQVSTRQRLRDEVAALERELASILTPEQQERLATVTNALLVPNMGPGGRGRGARGPGPGRGEQRGE